MQDFHLISNSNSIFDLNKVLISIGSLGDIKIEEDVPNILPRHCSLIVCDKEWGRCVCNLSESFPVMVNGQKVEDKQKLHNGDVISICGKEFTYLKKKEAKRPNTRITIKMDEKPSLKIENKKKEESKPIPLRINIPMNPIKTKSLIKEVKTSIENNINIKCKESQKTECSDITDEKSIGPLITNNIDYDDEVFTFDDENENIKKTQKSTSLSPKESTVIFANSAESDDEPFFFD